MYGYNFSERTRAILAGSREEALALDHASVGTEHILLALLAEGQGVGAAVVRNLGADAGAMRALVVQTLQRGEGPLSGPDLPYTTRAKQVLQLAAAEAGELGHRYTGTEHLLLGLVREGAGVGGQVLVHFGITLDRARAEVRRLFGSDSPLPPQEPA